MVSDAERPARTGLQRTLVKLSQDALAGCSKLIASKGLAPYQFRVFFGENNWVPEVTDLSEREVICLTLYRADKIEILF